VNIPLPIVADFVEFFSSSTDYCDNASFITNKNCSLASYSIIDTVHHLLKANVFVYFSRWW